MSLLMCEVVIFSKKETPSSYGHARALRSFEVNQKSCRKQIPFRESNCTEP